MRSGRQVFFEATLKGDRLVDMRGAEVDRAALKAQWSTRSAPSRRERAAR